MNVQMCSLNFLIKFVTMESFLEYSQWIDGIFLN